MLARHKMCAQPCREKLCNFPELVAGASIEVRFYVLPWGGRLLEVDGNGDVVG